jgi:hypothetical protein
MTSRVGPPEDGTTLPTGLITIGTVVLLVIAAAMGFRLSGASSDSPIEGVERLGVGQPAALQDARISADQALAAAAKAEFVRDGEPRVALIRFTAPSRDGAGAELVGHLVWVIHYGDLEESHGGGFVDDEGVPHSTAWIYRDYYVLVDADSAEVIHAAQF